MPADPMFSIRIPDDLRGAVVELARATDRSASSIMRLALRRYLAERAADTREPETRRREEVHHA